MVGRRSFEPESPLCVRPVVLGGPSAFLAFHDLLQPSRPYSSEPPSPPPAASTPFGSTGAQRPRATADRLSEPFRGQMTVTSSALTGGPTPSIARSPCQRVRLTPSGAPILPIPPPPPISGRSRNG